MGSENPGLDVKNLDTLNAECGHIPLPPSSYQRRLDTRTLNIQNQFATSIKKLNNFMWGGVVI